MSRESSLARALVDLSDTLVDDFDVVDLMQRLVDYCVGILAITAVGLLLTDRHGGLAVMASSSEESALVELYQLQVDEGPCLDCIAGGLPVSAPDLGDSQGRWPRFAPAAVAQGFRSVHALPLRLRSESIGAMNLFAAEPGPLPEADLWAAQALADIATIGVLQQRGIATGELLAEQLQTALNSRVVIEQAKGLLAATGGLSMDQAYELLRKHARDSNLRLTSVARSIVAGSIDPDLLLKGL